ncbi:MAG TPA: HAD hydrolase-like protein, partial [Thermomicrobiales bacterium]|nr:HAD hydrolase-like protein [Thermomicrobiales bacterium]
KVEPGRAVHIGDQPRSDVVGALRTGMRAALIDRYARHHPKAWQVPVFVGLDEFVDHILMVNQAAEVSR